MRNQVLQGNVLETINQIADKLVNCVVTSPPYWGLRDYGTKPVEFPAVEFSPVAGLPPIRIDKMVCSLGLEPDPWSYVGHMVLIFREVRRVLRDDGVLWLNLGDSYANVGKWGGSTGGKHVSGLHGDTNAGRGKKDYSELKNKDLVGIPWRVAMALQSDGWYLRSDIVWSKSNPMPESVTDRPTKAHEYIFLLAKSERYWYDHEAIKEPISESSMARISQENFDNQKDYKNKRSVWEVSTKPYPEAHFAVFNTDLIEPCVLAGCPEQVCCKCGEPWVRHTERVTGENSSYNGITFTNGKTKDARDHLSIVGRSERTAYTKTLGFKPSCKCNADTRPGVVFDPFLGSGTTAEVAIKHRRNWLGCELSEDYIDLIYKRLNGTQITLFDTA